MPHRMSSVTHAGWLASLILLLGIVCSQTTPVAMAQNAPLPQLPQSVRPLPQQAMKKLPLNGFSPSQARLYQHVKLSSYAIVSTAPAGQLASARVRRQDAVMLMPDLGRQRVVRLKLGDTPAGIAYHSEDAFTLVLVGTNKRAVGTVSMDRRGALTISADPDRDGVADYVEQWRGETGQTSFIRKGLGEDFLDALMAGKNAFCMSADALKASAPQGIGRKPSKQRRDTSRSATAGTWSAAFDRRTGLNMCSTSSTQDGVASAWRHGAGGPQDPLALACAQFGENLSRPARFSSLVRTDGDRPNIDAGPIADAVDIITGMIPDAGTAAALGALATALINAYGERALISAMVRLGYPTAETLIEAGAVEAGLVSAEAAAATLTTALAAVAAFLAVTFTPAHEGVAACESAGAGACQREAERERARDHAGGTGTSSHPNPGPEGDDSAFRAFCARRQDQRQEWQRVVDDQRSRNFTQCVNPLSGESTNDNSPFCRFLVSAMTPRQADIMAGIPSEGGTGRGGIDSPEDRIRARMREASQMIGDVRIVTCDPRICQPLP
jgi:hypothetical protein